MDAEIVALTSKVYTKQKGIIKGTAFPTAVSINNVLCHAAPFEGEEGDLVLKTGDLVKMYILRHFFPLYFIESSVLILMDIQHLYVSR